MIKLFSLKQQKKEENASGGASGGKRKATAAQLRLTKGMLQVLFLFCSRAALGVITIF